MFSVDRLQKGLGLGAKGALGCAVVLHFAFVLSDVTHLTDFLNRRAKVSDNIVYKIWNTAADYYGSLTFANRNFGFFAPKISADWAVQVTLADAAGQESEYRFELPSAEMEFKAYAMLGHFAASDSRMDLLSRFWSARAMRHAPGTRKVEVQVSRRVLPSMEEYRGGARVRKEQFYRTTFER